MHALLSRMGSRIASRSSLALASFVSCVALFSACGNDFRPASRIESVRILATRADKPYAKPGDAVEVELLAVDGRRDRTRTMRLAWLPAPCIRPSGTYYDCYADFGTAFPRGVDLTDRLVQGAKARFDVPADAIEKSGAAQSGVPFANVFVFTMACAGHVQYVGPKAASPQAVPFACFDDAGNELGPDDFVFAYSRVFVFADRTNANPVVEAITLDGQVVDPTVGISLAHCAGANETDTKCPKVPVDVVVPKASQEVDPAYVDRDGNVGFESLWVNWYVTDGTLGDEVRTLYDADIGRIANSANELTGPAAPGEQTLWAVVHDNRGGVNWLSVPVHGR